MSPSFGAAAAARSYAAAARAKLVRRAAPRCVDAISKYESPSRNSASLVNAELSLATVRRSHRRTLLPA